MYALNRMFFHTHILPSGSLSSSITRNLTKLDFVFNSFNQLNYRMLSKKKRTLQVIEANGKKDAYNGYYVNLTSTLFTPRFFKKTLQDIVLKQQKEGTHVFSLKIPATNSRMIKDVIDSKFHFHYANPKHAFFTLCLKEHKVEQCTYPPYKTTSAGVTGVVFDRQIEKVLVVTEGTGPIKKFKPPTGTVENDETPLEAVVRELKEETGIEVNSKEAFLVANTYAKEYQGTPNVANIFAFILDEMKTPTPQQGEIANAEWMPISQFLQIPDEEQGKPWLLRQAVDAALNALKNNVFWKKQTVHFTNGKPIEMFSPPSK